MFFLGMVTLDCFTIKTLIQMSSFSSVFKPSSNFESDIMLKFRPSIISEFEFACDDFVVDFFEG